MSHEAADTVWRDPDGVVHVAATESQLPESVETAIVSYLVLSDSDDFFQRLDEVRDLLDSWHDAALEEAAQSLDVPLGEACESVDVEATPRMITPDVASALEALHDEPAIGHRLNLLVEALRLVDEWLSYHLDPEKLVGHLVLSHDVPTPLASRDHDHLLRVHENLHR